MSEEQIERRVESAMDGLDARLLRGDLSQADYDREVVRLDAWSQRQYALRGVVA